MSETNSRSVPQRFWYRRPAAVGGLLLIALSLGACNVLELPDNHRPGAVAATGGFADALSATGPPIEVDSPAKQVQAVNPAGRPRPKLPPAVTVRPLQLGSDGADVLARLGEPRSQRQSLTARLWRYGDGACAVDLLFFFDMANDRYRLAMIRQDGRPVAPADASRCLFQRRTAAMLS